MFMFLGLVDPVHVMHYIERTNINATRTLHCDLIRLC
jgi:hypothetical protein